MKRTITCLFLLLVLVFLNCNRFSAEYTINCAFGQTLFGPAILVMVDYAGDVLETFDLPSGTSSFSGNATTHDSDSPDYYDLHLIIRDTFSSSAYVYSTLGVKNGAITYLGPQLGENFAPGKVKTLLISGIHTINDGATGNWEEAPVLIGPTQAKGLVRVLHDQSAVIKMRANNEPELRSLFIPESVMFNANDTLFFSWDDFKQESNFQPVTIEGKKPYLLYCFATDQTFRHMAFLEYQSGSDHAGGIFIPEGMSATLNKLSVYAQTERSAYEKIFSLGEPIQFGPLNMDIENWDMKNGNMQVNVSGEVDLIQLSFWQDILTPSGFGAYFYWQISGGPADFAERKRPDIAKWIPDWVKTYTLFNSGNIRAYRFDLYNEFDVKAGFPFRSTERFADARSGMTNMWVEF